MEKLIPDIQLSGEIHRLFPGVCPEPRPCLFKPDVYRDQRGYFFESYSKSWLPDETFVQENHALSTYGTIRGLHYQSSPGQGKLVRVTSGMILDIAVDIRRNSPSKGCWAAVILSATNKHLLFIPVGFAHGYAVLSDVAEVQYKCTNLYDPKTECGIAWNDPDIGIPWGLNDIEPLISERDRNNQSFKDYLSHM